MFYILYISLHVFNTNFLLGMGGGGCQKLNKSHFMFARVNRDIYVSAGVERGGMLAYELVGGRF